MPLNEFASFSDCLHRPTVLITRILTDVVSDPWRVASSQSVDSSDPESHEVDLDASGRHHRVCFVADEARLGRPDVGLADDIANPVHRCSVGDRVVDADLRSE